MPTPTPEWQSVSRAELRGVLHALRGRRAGEHLVIVLDSEYVFKGITKWSVNWSGMDGAQGVKRYGIGTCGRKFGG